MDCLAFSIGVPLNTFMLIQITQGSGTLLSLTDAKAHLRVNISDDDNLISQYCAVATDIVQRETGLRFFADVYQEMFPCFARFNQAMQLTRYPVNTLNSIKYYDMANTLQTWSSGNYHAIKPTNCQAYFQPIFALFYPVTRPRPDAVQVTYTTGVKTISLTGNTTNGQKTVTNLSDTTGISAGWQVVGTGIPDLTTVASVDSGTQVTLSGNATADNTGTALTFTAPLPLPAIQAARLLVGHFYNNRESELTTGAVPKELSYGLERLFASMNTRGYY